MFTHVQEEHVTSVLMEEQAQKMEAAFFSETSVTIYPTTRHHIWEDNRVDSHRYKKLRFRPELNIFSK
jgi:hypothetical protein